MAPAVSVLLPVRDARPTLPVAVASILDQTFTDFELVAVDDGSRDGSAAWLHEAAARDPRIRVLSTGGAGLVPALQAGLAAARAPLLARMDADDRSHPERLARQVALLAADPTLGVAACRIRIVREGGVAGGFQRYERWLNALVTPADHAREIFVESPVVHPSVLLRTDECRALGGWRDVRWAEDYDLWLRYHAAGRGIAKVPEVLFDWRDSDGRLTRTDPRYGRDRFLLAKAHFLARGPLSGPRAAIVWGAGPIGRRLARALRNEGIAIPAFVDVDPRKIGVKRPGGAPVLAPEGLAAHRGLPVLAAVGARGARTLIRSRLAAMGYREGADFICAA